MPLVRKGGPVRRYITRPEFAMRMGVSNEAVYKAIRVGRIKTKKKKGQILIDSRTEAPKFLATSTVALANAVDRTFYLNGGNNGHSPANTKSQMTIAQAREKQEVYKAKKAELEYFERIKTVIETRAVQRDWVSIGTLIRKAVTGIPDRLAPLVAAESNVDVCYRILDEECRIILEDLASDIERRTIDNPGFGVDGSDTATETSDD